MSGEANSNIFPDPIGHSWVIDGYKYYKYVIVNNLMIEPEPYTTYCYYNHINWGWNGHSNGYFLDGVFAANQAKSYDTNQSTSSYSFYNLSVSAIHL